MDTLEKVGTRSVAKIVFLFDGQKKTASSAAGEDPPPTLLAVARRHGVPLLANCEAGACGACLVEVDAAGASAVPMSEAETAFLQARGRLGTGRHGRGTARLACQYRLGRDESVRVRFTTMIGCL